MWTISSLEAGTFAFLVTAMSPEPDSKKRVADYLLTEGRQVGRREGRAVQDGFVGKTAMDKRSQDMEALVRLRSLQAEEMFWVKTQRD